MLEEIKGELGQLTRDAESLVKTVEQGVVSAVQGAEQEVVSEVKTLEGEAAAKVNAAEAAAAGAVTEAIVVVEVGLEDAKRFVENRAHPQVSNELPPF